MFTAIKRLFGPQVCRHMMVVFNGIDALDDTPGTPSFCLSFLFMSVCLHFVSVSVSSHLSVSFSFFFLAFFKI